MEEPFLSEKDLIRGCMEGRKDAWDRFVQDFSKLIWWSIRKTLSKSPFGQRQGLAEDLFQEVFEKLLDREELSKLGRISSIKGYLVVISSRVAIDRLRHLSFLEQKSLSLEPEGSAGEEGQISAQPRGSEVLRQEERGAVTDALRDLSAKERACVELCYLDGKSHRDIAELLGLPQDTVSSILRRSKDKLRKVFSEKGLFP